MTRKRRILFLLLPLLFGCTRSMQTVIPAPTAATESSTTTAPTAISISTPTQAPAEVVGCDLCQPLKERDDGPKPQIGRIAYLDEAGQLLVVNLDGSGQWALGELAVALLDWSSSGETLLYQHRAGGYAAVRYDGTLIKRFDNLPQAPFWIASEALGDDQDWLALPQPDGTLSVLKVPSGETRQVLPPGRLGEDGKAVVRWESEYGPLYTPGLEQLQKGSLGSGPLKPQGYNSPQAQIIAAGEGFVPASQDFRQDYYHPLDAVPGTRLVLLAHVSQGCNSCWDDSLPLVTLHLDWGQIVPVGVSMLASPEGYAWNPVRPGLLALAAEGSRFLHEDRSLILFDASTGELRTLANAELAVFEPAWSPDGGRLAFSAQPAQGELAGIGEELEKALSGRAIYGIGLDGGEPEQITQPGPDEMDGWPQWIDEETLLFARRDLDSGAVQLRRISLSASGSSDGADEVIVPQAAGPEFCHRGGCHWDAWLAYSPGKIAETAPQWSPTPTPQSQIQISEGQLGWQTYTNPSYGFSFSFPQAWPLSEEPNRITLSRDGYTLSIGYRRPAENTLIQRTGVPAGDLAVRGAVHFGGAAVARYVVVFEGKEKAVLYANGDQVEAGELVFTLSLDGAGIQAFDEVDIPLEIQTEADEIVESFD